MPITYYNPNRPQEDLYRFTMSQIMNMAILTAQQKARQREADRHRTHEEAMTTRQQRWIEGRESRKEQAASASQAVEVGRQKRAKWEQEKKEELERKRRLQVKQVTIAGRPAVIDYSGKLQFVDKKPTKDAAVIQEFDAWKKANPKGTWQQFYKQRKGGVGTGGPKGRTAEAQYWAGILGVDLKNPKGRTSVNKVMDKLYGRGDREQKLFLDAFKAVHSEFDEPEDSLTKAQTLFDKVMTSEKHRDFILEQHPDARYDFANGRWYVMRNGRKNWIEVSQ